MGDFSCHLVLYLVRCAFYRTPLPLCRDSRASYSFYRMLRAVIGVPSGPHVVLNAAGDVRHIACLVPGALTVRSVLEPINTVVGGTRLGNHRT